MSFSALENDTLNQSELNEIKIKENNHIDSRFLDKMNIRGGEPLSGLKSLCKNETGGVWNKIKQWKTFGGIFSEINLDSSIIDGILLTKLIFLTSKLEVSTLNNIWSFLHSRDFKEMGKIVTKQIDLNFNRIMNFAEINNNFKLSNR